MREKLYKCDDCGREDKFASYNKARKKGGWAVSADYKNCYCPNCAPKHRFGGATKANVRTGSELPAGWEQLKIDNIR